MCLCITDTVPGGFFSESLKMCCPYRWAHSSEEEEAPTLLTCSQSGRTRVLPHEGPLPIKTESEDQRLGAEIPWPLCVLMCSKKCATAVLRQVFMQCQKWFYTFSNK